MDLDKMLKTVNNLNEYISISQEIGNVAHCDSKIQFNMSSVLLLKKVRSLEVEYFNKCEGNGAAFMLFGRMVEQPASKTWGLLGKELVSLLQYWLDAMRKHLIKHSHHWWTFLKLLLKFIKAMRVKDRSLPDTLVEGTAECLLDLATSSEPDAIQRHEILYCLNLICAESSREIRFALKNRLECYFTKLATLLSTCGYLPTQYSMLEALLRWLLPRHDTSVRQAAAAKWFPVNVYGKKALQLFLERPWQNFFQDARDFLNAFNANGNLVTSFLCRKITVGAVAVLSSTDKRETYLDLNAADGSASVVLEPRLLDALRVRAPAWESLRVTRHDARALRLRREGSEVTLIVHTTLPPRLSPSDAVVAGACETRLVFSSTTELRRLDRALRDVFEDKYELLLDLDKPISLSPEERSDHKKGNNMDDDIRFSHPVEVQKRKRSGYVVRSRKPVGWNSPSTASTTSLAQLHEKLASLPQYKYDKEAVHVCALPELSTVTEVSESDDRQSIHSTSTLKLNRPFGVCHRNNKSSERSSQSDGELHKPKVGRYLSPAAKEDETSTSCLLVATIGSADESVINDTIERLTKNKDFQPDNIVDLLVQEALQKGFNDRELRDSGINTGDNRKTQEPHEINSEAIENTPAENPKTDLGQNKETSEKNCTVISNTTTDESNDVVYDTPLNFVNVRKRNIKAKVTKEKVSEKPKEEKIFDVKEVEAFFSQHITENNRGEIVISPTLARKINESSSDSEQFEDCLMIHEDHNVNIEQIDVYDIDIIECLNTIVDKVCTDLDKCTELLDRDSTPTEILNIAENIVVEHPKVNSPLPLKDVSNIQVNRPTEDQNASVESKETNTKGRKTIKLTFNTKKTAKSRTAAKKKKNKLELEPANMSPIKEMNDASIADTATVLKTPEQARKSPSSESGDLNAVLATRRKRKLYSPKDDGDNESIIQVTEMDEDKDFKSSKIQTLKYKATSYKDIEMDRKKRIRQPRRKKSTNKSESSPSPRTKKMDDIFNQLKEKVECPDPVKVVDKKAFENDLAVYNFTSDSEDEDFKKKKIEVQKRISSTTIASVDSNVSRHGRSIHRINYSEPKSSDDSNKNKAPKQKRSVKRKKTQPKSRVPKPVPALVDEKMRDAVPEELNTSLVVEKPSENVPEEPNLILHEKPEMEPIPEEKITEVKDKPKRTTRKNKKKEALSLKKEKDAKLNTLQIERDNDDRTSSPLPGLNVETMPAAKDDANDSVTANMMQKFQKIYRDGPEAYINESNTTQNLLSDIEKINYSPPPLNLTDEFNRAGNYSKLSDVSQENTEVRVKSSKKKTNRKDAVIDLSENLNTTTVKILRIKKEKGLEMKNNCNNETQEIINLSKISDNKSEVSIATVGKSPITAHGDSDELPPDSELLTENIKPRDVDVEYLDKSVKEYFDRLRSEVNKIPSNESRKDSNDSDSTKVLNIDRRSKSKSPVVSIARLSFEDISKWLPSRRNSDTDYRSSKETSKEVTKRNPARNTKIKEYSELASRQESDNENSPVQKIDKISLEFDSSNNESRDRIQKSEIADHKHQKPEIAKSKRKKQIDSEEIVVELSGDGNLKEVKPKEKLKGKKSKRNKKDDSEDVKKTTSSKWLRSRDKSVTKESENTTISPVHEIINTPKKSKTSQENRMQASQENRKSLISPINLSFDFRAAKNESSPSPTVKKLGSVLSNLDDELEETENTRRQDLGKLISIRSKKNIELSSPISKSSPKVEVVSRLKRKSKSPVIENVKRRKVEDTFVSISDSGPSVSSVSEWFRRNAPVSRAENVNTSFRESIENVMEKLDTTLIEIHQNTSKKFIHMFVDAQKQLGGMRQQRRQMYKSVASDILAQVVNVIDEKFAEMDKRSQEMDAEFMEQLKVQASALIREDCKKKQAMVTLLREDLGAMLARVNRKDTV